MRRAAEQIRRPKHAETQPREPPDLDEKPAALAAVSSAAAPPLPMLQVLVTPKISFALPQQAHWKTVEDIEEEALREAFLARFPVRLRADHLSFKCATPGAQLGSHPMLVYRISASGVTEDRVLLSVLSELDKSYTAKFTEQLERARADCLAASNCFQASARPTRMCAPLARAVPVCFPAAPSQWGAAAPTQVIADEVRSAQETASRRWEAEVRSLKEFQSKNQKRLFLLEQERDQLREQLQRASTSSERTSAELRAAIGGTPLHWLPVVARPTPSE